MTDASQAVRSLFHEEADVAALHEAIVCQVVSGITFAVHGHVVNVAAFALARNVHALAILQVDCHLVKIRRSYYILVAARAYGIEA